MITSNARAILLCVHVLLGRLWLRRIDGCLRRSWLRLWHKYRSRAHQTHRRCCPRAHNQRPALIVICLNHLYNNNLASEVSGGGVIYMSSLSIFLYMLFDVIFLCWNFCSIFFWFVHSKWCNNIYRNYPREINTNHIIQFCYSFSKLRGISRMSNRDQCNWNQWQTNRLCTEFIYMLSNDALRTNWNCSLPLKTPISLLTIPVNNKNEKKNAQGGFVSG